MCSPEQTLIVNANARGLEVVDYRDLAVWPRDKVYPWREYGWPPNKSRALPQGRRSWEKTTAIMLHTTDARGMGAKRFLGVPAHLGDATDGTPVLMHHLDRILYHGHTANSFSIGIEISSKPEGFDHPEQIQTARDLVAYAFAERQQHHEGPMAIMAHRQSRQSRANDPGAVIWREVGEWAIDVLGLKMGPVVGSGQAIPSSWRN